MIEGECNFEFIFIEILLPYVFKSTGLFRIAIKDINVFSDGLNSPFEQNFPLIELPRGHSKAALAFLMAGRHSLLMISI